MFAKISICLVSCLCVWLISCKESSNSPNSLPPVPATGAPFTVTCKAGVKGRIYVSIISGSRQEDFGTIGAPNDQDGGETVSFIAIDYEKGLTVRWGVKGEDGLEMTHLQKFDLNKYAPYADKIMHAEVIYFGGGKWEFKAWDSYDDEVKKEIIP